MMLIKILTAATLGYLLYLVNQTVTFAISGLELYEKAQLVIIVLIVLLLIEAGIKIRERK